MIVGIAGRKGSGKDEVARMLVREHGFRLLRFAEPLKEMLKAMYYLVGLDEDETERRIEGDLKEVPCEYLCGVTPRRAMQTLGTEWGRDCVSPDLWTNVLRFRCSNRSLKIVVPDVRYRNECEAIFSLDGKVVRVDASRRVPPNEFSNHTSESEVEHLPVDFEIDNNGTLFELTRAVRSFVEVVGA